LAIFVKNLTPKTAFRSGGSNSTVVQIYRRSQVASFSMDTEYCTVKVVGTRWSDWSASRAATPFTFSFLVKRSSHSNSYKMTLPSQARVKRPPKSHTALHASDAPFISISAAVQAEPVYSPHWRNSSLKINNFLNRRMCSSNTCKPEFH
jgi:hypothetical protein